MSDHPLTHEEVLAIMSARTPALRELIARFLQVSDNIDCPCPSLGFAHFI